MIQLINKACYLNCGYVNETNVNLCWNSFSNTKAYAITCINPRNSDKYPTSVTYFFKTDSTATQVTIFNVVSICPAEIVYFVV